MHGNYRRKTVFILGAGASVGAGVPVMGNFIDVAEDLMRGADLGPDKHAFDLVFKGIRNLNRVFEKSALDTRNLEAVFVAFEMGKLLGRLGDLSTDELQNLPNAMVQLIVRTIEETARFFYMERHGVLPSGGYLEFASGLKHCFGD